MLIGRDGVVRSEVECVVLDVEFGHFLVRDFHVHRIKIAIDLVANLARFRLGATDQLNNHLVTNQRPAQRFCAM